MAKIADEYLQLDPWRIIEKGWNPSRSLVSESLFSLGNEFMGVRGYFEEGSESESLLGSYFNGIYEEEKVGKTSYKGIVDKTHFMVNSVDWLYTRIIVDDEQLCIGRSVIADFTRILDMRRGTVERSFVWYTISGKKLRMIFTRFLDMEQPGYGYQRISVIPLAGTPEGTVLIRLGTDFRTIHRSRKTCYWTDLFHGKTETGVAMTAQTVSTAQKVFSGFEWEASVPVTRFSSGAVERFTWVEFSAPFSARDPAVISRIIYNAAEKASVTDAESFHQKGLQKVTCLLPGSFALAETRQEAYWQRIWEQFDIRITGDEKNQQGIRFCIFQLQQTYHGQDVGNNIGAKGLTGEAYNGHAFWDTETYCLPFYLFTNPGAAKNLLEFRYSTLPQAMDRARQLDCRGACYPVATLHGEEACDLWQHSSLQFQPSTGVAYWISHDARISGDTDFLYGHGAEMLIQITRFLVSRGSWNQRGDGFGFYAVMGPDEFHMMVNNNCYTNIMAKKTFEYTLAVLAEMKKSVPGRHEEIVRKTGLTDTECKEIQRCADHMIVLYDETTALYEQHEGYFGVPHIDIDAIPVTDFPLYSHWSYDRIYRTDMIKQPDVLMFLFLYYSEFDPAVIRKNYDYYEPRTIHESSLSPSIHSIFASSLGKHEEAFRFFGFATRMDLDNYNRNTGEGLHTTSIAAAWVNIVYGFGGLRSDGDVLSLSPSLPAAWESYEFRFVYQEIPLCVLVTREQVEVRRTGTMISADQQEPVFIEVYDTLYRLDISDVHVPLPAGCQG
jgi:maltose phosphorylase